ncbi:MAG TPA: neutral/alkaline non-lysosomal ceramidase N-terminal domain-containing protein [Gemmataceae bacterium]|nr:neutral/alkaline non-lysosomal ceramidase N-terminal domain-containing protein [Gemmataceae bacterium]
MTIPPHRLLGLVCAAVCFLPCPARADAPDAPLWKAGAARVKITPDKPMWMAGYASRTRPADETLIDLYAKALALEDPDGKRFVLVTMDLVGVPRDLSQAVCADLKDKYGLPRESVVLAASHTHTGPIVGSNLRDMFDLDEMQQKRIDNYAAALHKNLVAVVGKALDDLAPARLAWGNGHVGFAVNRRNNKEADVPKLREVGELKGPVDHDVPVLSVRDPQGKLRAVVFGYACHATVLNSMAWSGDYPGFAQLAVEKMHPDATAFFWAGCGGDQNPLPRRSVFLAQKYGQELADGVQAVLDEPMTPIEGNLRSVYTEIDLPLADLPSRDQLVKDTIDMNHAVAARAKRLLAGLEKKGSLAGSYPYPVQVCRLGPDLTWVMLGGEAVVDYSLRLKKELGPGHTWVAAYTNDVMAYIPSLRVLKEGGYEGGGAMVYYGLPAVWSPLVEETIVAAVHAQVEKVRDGAAKDR